MSQVFPSYAEGFATSAGESAHPELWKGLVGAWVPPLGVTGGTLFDVSGYKNHGTLTNMEPATDWMAGEKGWTLDYDGVDESVITSNATGVLDFERTDPFSISSWHRTVDAAITLPLSLWAKFEEGGGNPGYYMQLRGPDAGDPYQVSLRGITSGHFATTNFPRSSDTEWHHLLMTYDGSSVAAGLKLYEDAIDLAPTVLDDTLASSMSNSVPFQIGKRESVSFPGPYEGQIGPVYVWNRELTANHALRLFVDTLAPFVLARRPLVGGPAASGLIIPIAMHHYPQLQGAN